MKKNFLYIILIMGFLFNYCKKDKSESKIVISGITKTDKFGNSIGTIDTTDWRINDNWQQDELNLFSRNSDKPTDKIPPRVGIVSAYPNPAVDFINFIFSIDTSNVCDIRIVDSNLNILVQKDSLKSGLNLIDIKWDSKFSKGTLYRIYYMIYSTNKINRGHGDFEFIN